MKNRRFLLISLWIVQILLAIHVFKSCIEHPELEGLKIFIEIWWVVLISIFLAFWMNSLKNTNS